MLPHRALLLPLFLASLLALRGILAISEKATPGEHIWLKEKVRASLQELSSPVRPGELPLVIFMGASEAEVDLNAGEVTARMKELGFPVKVLNLALREGSRMPMFMERVRRDLGASGRRAALIVLLPSAGRLTEAGAKDMRITSAFDIYSVIFELSLWGSVPNSWSDNANLAAMKYIFGERSPAQLFTLIKAWAAVVLPSVPNPVNSSRSVYDIENEPSNAAEMVYTSVYSEKKDTDPDVLELRRHFEKDNVFKGFLQVQQACCDILGMHPNPEQMEWMQSAARRLAEHADQVVFAELPDNPRINRAPEAEQRLHGIFRDLSRVSGFPLWIAPPFPQEGFMDPMHLLPSASRDTSRFFAERIAADLQKRK